MKPIKSLYNNGTIIEILNVQNGYIVRKRKNSVTLTTKKFDSLHMAINFFNFIR